MGCQKGRQVQGPEKSISWFMSLLMLDLSGRRDPKDSNREGTENQDK